MDDEIYILSSLQRQLRSKGYNILTAESGLKGLEQMACHLRMPEMNGAEFLGKVRAMYPATVRIILSGYSDLEAVTGAVNTSELYKFLTKPWNEDELLETVHEAFRLYEMRRDCPENVGKTSHVDKHVKQEGQE